MRARTVLMTLAALVAARAASGQTVPPPPARGYVEVVAQSAFGNVTSQSYGAEFGFLVYPSVEAFVEGGVTRNVATAQIDAAAQMIAGALSQSQTAVGFSVREPVTFGLAGAKYLLAAHGRLQPYVSAGVGFAKVKHDVTFSVAGADVSTSLPQFGIVLGSDLTGTETDAMVGLGAGAAYPVWQSLVLDLQFRYGRIFSSGNGINVGRAGVGFGIRF